MKPGCTGVLAVMKPVYSITLVCKPISICFGYLSAKLNFLDLFSGGIGLRAYRPDECDIMAPTADRNSVEEMGLSF